MANKSITQKRTDPETEALKDAWASGAKTKQDEVDALTVRLEAAPWLFEMAGKVKTLSFNESQSRFFKLILLKKVKDSKEYREKYGMTWEQFCEHAHVNKRWIDEQLADLKPFKVEFLEAFLQFSEFDFSKIKYLGQSALEENLQLQGDRLLFDGEAIPFEPEAVQAVIEQLQDQLRSEKEEKKAALGTKDKVLKAKEELLNKQEKQLARYDKEAKAKGLTLEEDAFLQQMENMRIGFDGFYMVHLDPAGLAGQDLTPRMTAAYISALQYMRTQINAAYDTAVETYGDPSMFPEEAWTPGKPLPASPSQGRG